MGSNQDIHCLQGVACSSPVMPGLTRHPVDNGSPSGRLFVYWIPAFAGMTKGGAGMTGDHANFGNVVLIFRCLIGLSLERRETLSLFSIRLTVSLYRAEETSR